MFKGWENFFLMIGPSAASLIGLLFVVVTLTAGRERSAALRGAALYLTPTVFHFSVVLAIAAAAMAPVFTPMQTTALIGVIAGFSLIYTTIIGVRLGLADGGAKPHWTDFWCYGVAPPAIYLGLAGADSLMLFQPKYAPLGVAFVLVVLLFTGIRNAWDLITWMAPGAATPQAALPAAPPAPPRKAPRKKAS